MSVKRSAANPIFSRPLTLEETAKIPKQRQEGKQIVCSKCGLAGGTLTKNSDGSRSHQDSSKCAVLRQRRKLVRNKR